MREGHNNYQVHVGVEELNDMLKDRLPPGSKLVAVDREIFDRGMRFLLYHPDYPKVPEGQAVPPGNAIFERSEDGTVRIVEVNGWD